MSSAASRVFGVAELLELILLYLPVRDLLLAQAVSRSFRGLIQQSPTLQHALFLRATPTTTNTPWNDYQTNTLLEECFPYFFIRSLVLERSYPFITERASLKALPANSNPTRTRAFMRPEASWRCMLLSNPPVTTLTVATVTDSQLLGQHFIVGDLCFQPGDGLRMGVLYDTVLDFVAQPHASSFCLKWHCLPRATQAAIASRSRTLERLMPKQSTPKPRITLSLFRVMNCTDPALGTDDLQHLKSDAHAPPYINASHVDIEHLIRQDIL